VYSLLWLWLLPTHSTKVAVLLSLPCCVFCVCIQPSAIAWSLTRARLPLSLTRVSRCVPCRASTSRTQQRRPRSSRGGREKLRVGQHTPRRRNCTVQQRNTYQLARVSLDQRHSFCAARLSAEAQRTHPCPWLRTTWDGSASKGLTP
jgi:hypothetical protein